MSMSFVFNFFPLDLRVGQQPPIIPLSGGYEGLSRVQFVSSHFPLEGRRTGEDTWEHKGVVVIVLKVTGTPKICNEHVIRF